MSRLRVAAVVVAAAILTAVWLLPNVGGGLFVEVRGARFSADGSAVIVDLVNRYPIPVILAYQRPAFRVALYTLGTADGGAAAWHTTAEDPEAEAEIDSPEGTAAVLPAVVGTGVTTKTIPVTWPASAPRNAEYTAQVWVYGVASARAPIARVGS